MVTFPRSPVENGEEIDRKAKEMPKLKMVTKGKRRTVEILESGGCSAGLTSNCWFIGPLLSDGRPVRFVLAMVAIFDDSDRADFDIRFSGGSIV